MLRQLWAIALGALVLFPVAAATTGRAEFETIGAVTFPADANATFSPLALYAGDATQFTGTISAPTLRVWTYERQDIRIDPAVIPWIQTQKGGTDERFFIVHDATVSIAPGPGIFGLYPEAAGRLAFHAAGPMRAEPQSTSAIPADAARTDAPNLPGYYKQLTGNHLFMEASGSAAYTGAASIKSTGPSLQIAARENTTEFDTGVQQTSATEFTTRWLYLEWDVGFLMLESTTPLQMGAAKMDSFALDGTVIFTPSSGELESQGVRSSPPPGSSTHITGRVEGDFRPTGDDRGARLTLAGDIRSTNFQTQSTSVPLGPSAVGSSWMRLGVVLAGLVVTCGAVVAVSRQRSTEDDDPVAYYSHYAFIAEEESNYAAAFDWVKAARQYAPKDADLAMWEATLHVNLKQPEDALADYAAASQFAPADGEPDYWAAILLIRRGHGNDYDRALECLERSLRREPERAGTIERDSLFAPLHGPDFTAMLDEAEGRLENEC